MMKQKIKSLFFIILAVCIFSSGRCKNRKRCPKGSHNHIVIKNNSSTVICWTPFDQDSIFYVNGEMSIVQKISPGLSDNYSIRGETCWEEKFLTINDGFSYLFIFSYDTVQAIGWTSISGTNRGLLKRIKVDLNYLEQNDFTIAYP